MKTDKIAEVLESETRLWNMRESDIRGRAVLDYDALKLITDKLNTLILAQEQLDDVSAVLGISKDDFQNLVLRCLQVSPHDTDEERARYCAEWLFDAVQGDVYRDKDGAWQDRNPR